MDLTPRPRTVVAAAVLLAAVAIVYLVVDDGYDAPRPTHAVAPPMSNHASVGDEGTTTVFDRFVIPDPQTWDGASDESDIALSFTDRTSCTAETVECPHVLFVNLASDEEVEYFGGDPLLEWTHWPCLSGSNGELGGSEFELNGEAAWYYRVTCGAEGERTRHAWLIPDKQLLVLTYAGTAGTLAPEIVQAVLEQGRWM